MVIDAENEFGGLDPTPPPTTNGHRKAGASLVAEELANIGDAELARALGEIRAALAAPTTTKRRAMFRDAVEVLRATHSAPSWLIQGLVTRSGVLVCGGAPKASKKTWLMLELAIAVATGTAAFGEFYAERGRAAYFFAEDAAQPTQHRLRALMSNGRTLEAGRLFLQPREHFIDITRDEDLAWLIASARRLGPIDLLILDPLRDVSSAAEDSSDEMSPVMRRLRLLGQILGCTVAVVHHAAKPGENASKRSGGQRLRGSSAIHGAADVGLYVVKSGGDGVAAFTITIESEIKGARSAGTFDLSLAIEDDQNGQAVGARWRVERDTPTPADKGSPATTKRTGGESRSDITPMELAAYRFVLYLADRGEVGSRTFYKAHESRPATVPAAKMIGVLDALLARGMFRLDERGHVRPPSSQLDLETDPVRGAS